MSRFKVTDLPLPGLKLVERQRVGDARGLFSRIYCAEEFDADGSRLPIAQINHSYTARAATVRGMHFQISPRAEIKFVTCIRGEIWDVAVDVRARSATFLRWHAERLSADNGRALFIPEGFAHGFQALTDDVELLYCHSAPYTPLFERGINPQDPRLGIDWPLPITEISAKDSQHPKLDEQFAGVTL